MCRPKVAKLPVSSDAELVARARLGERAAFRLLIERHQRWIYHLAFGIVRHHEDAMDVVQDTFIDAYEHLSSFKAEATFSTWLYRIAWNAAIDTVRAFGRGTNVPVEERMLTDEGTFYEPYGTSGPNPQMTLLRQELAANLNRAMTHLGETHRATVVLREVDGLSYEEIAEVLGVPIGTVMSRLFHARRKMQEALREYVNDDTDAVERPRPTPPAKRLRANVRGQSRARGAIDTARE